MFLLYDNSNILLAMLPMLYVTLEAAYHPHEITSIHTERKHYV